MAAQGNKYTYDGTFEGYLCAVLAALRSGKVPVSISDRRTAGFTDDAINVTTSFKDAQYLYHMISVKSSAEVQQMTADYFLTDSTGLEINLYKMIFCSLKYGARVAEDYKSELMRGIQMAIRDLYREAQSLLSNIEFFRGEEASCAVINPHNLVLPLIRKPLLKREELDDLIVFDRRHCLMLGRKEANDMLTDIRQISIKLPETGSEAYEILWPAVKDAKFDVRFAGATSACVGIPRDYEPLWSMAQ